MIIFILGVSIGMLISAVGFIFIELKNLKEEKQDEELLKAYPPLPRVSYEYGAEKPQAKIIKRQTLEEEVDKILAE